MKANAVIFTILTIYFVIVAAMYAVWNLVTHGYIEWVGTTALTMGAGLNGFIAFYLFLVIKKQGGVPVQDLEEADIDDADPELGEFSPWSWWPILLATGGAICFFAVAAGWWIFPFGGVIVVIGLVGLIYEYDRGNFAH